MSKRTKPTNMELKTAVNNIIRELSYMQQAILHVTSTLNALLDFKNYREPLHEWLQSQVKEEEGKSNDKSGDSKSKTRTIRSSNSKNRRTTGRKTNTTGKDKIIGIRKNTS